MKLLTLLAVLATLTLSACGGGGDNVVCREVRFIHLDGSWEYTTICDDARNVDRYVRDGVTERELFPE